MALKDTWKATGTGLGHAFRDLGKALVKTVATGVEKADNWANSDEDPKQKNTATEVAQEAAEKTTK